MMLCRKKATDLPELPILIATTKVVQFLVFEWDPAKDAANRRKHGLSFELAVRAFDGRTLTLSGRKVGGEYRSLTIGRIETLLVIAVVLRIARAGPD
ncbi:BrnT family toxin [Maricaulis maris]|uniref:BrnT family toxin n=1 Tax=Maricaulis maris TaxID=74318 RepID=UPI003A901B58